MKRIVTALLLLVLSGSVSAWAGDVERNVYDLDATWTNASGQAVAWQTLRGKPRVVTMFYSSCAYACPRITSDMKRVEQGLSDAEKDAVGFVMASFDTGVDTPEALSAFGATWSLDPARWTLLTGALGSVEDLAAVLGIRYRRELGGEFSHGNVIVVVDREGRIVHRKDGLGGDVTGVVGALHGLLSGP